MIIGAIMPPAKAAGKNFLKFFVIFSSVLASSLQKMKQW
jgi:hypothetical protein